jgi:hypothetical protein
MAGLLSAVCGYHYPTAALPANSALLKDEETQI